MNKTAKTLFIIGVSCILLSLLLLARFVIEEVYSKEMNSGTMSVLLEKTKKIEDKKILINGRKN